MELGLRFGMHRDIPVIHELLTAIDSVMMPAHILVYQQPSSAAFLSSLGGTPYSIDPMTYLLQKRKSDMLNSSGQLPPSVDKLLHLYSPGLVDTIQAMRPEDVLSVAALGSLEALVEACLNAQETLVTEGVSRSAASKYLERYSSPMPGGPRCFIPPYFVFSSVASPWYEASRRCTELALAHASDAGTPIEPIIVVLSTSLAADAALQIVDDFAECPAVTLWLDGFSSSTALRADIRAIRELVASFESNGVETRLLYGGYVAATLCVDGLRGISHGILYSEDKASDATPGNGGVPDRYYIPGIHQFRSLSQADLILHQHAELVCDCAVCADVLGDNPDNFIHFNDERELLEKHFLLARRKELDALDGRSARDLARELTAIHRDYSASIARLPNPDALVSSARMKGLDHLLEWADALEQDV